jgi:hypothetical protein
LQRVFQPKSDAPKRAGERPSRFVYAPKKVIVRGLGIMKPQRQLDNLIEWLGAIHSALLELELELV